MKKDKKYKIDDLVIDIIDGFNAFLVKKLKNGYWRVNIPMGRNYYDVWHEEDFSLYREDD